MVRVLSSLVCLAFATEAVAAGGATFVCRMTGEVMDDCCCPKAESLQRVPIVQHADCCDVYRPLVGDVAAIPSVSGTQASANLLYVQPLAWTWPSLDEAPPRVARRHPPGGALRPYGKERLFQALSQLLI